MTAHPIDAHAIEVDSPAGETDVRLAARLAGAAGDCLLELRARVDSGELDVATEEFGAGRGELGRLADRAAQSLLATALAAARPTDAVLSEEATDDPRRLAAERVWIVDPLDGTREFTERNADGTWRDDFAVHVALWQRDRGLTDAAIALPGRARVYATDDGRSPPTSPSSGRPLRIAVSRTRPPSVARRLFELGSVELVPMGSTGAKVAAVIDGTVDAYVHAGGQFEWDSAAPVAVARAAGLIATRLDGSPLVYNKPDARSPDLLVCRADVLPDIRLCLGEAVALSITDVPSEVVAGR
jgi:3'(2'), 5'-bisphosphate nucleotidase